MKRFVLLSIMLPVVLLLSACGNTGAGSSSRAGGDVMTPALELAAGTLRLEGTDQAIDSETAAQLLPLWQLMNELSTNGATAPEEVTAVIEQIESTMTPQQVQAISQMNIAQDDLFASRPQSAGSTGGAAASAGNSNMVGALAGGGGAPPADGGFSGGGPGPGADLQSGSSVSQTSGTSGTASLITQVIDLLESKLQA